MEKLIFYLSVLLDKKPVDFRVFCRFGEVFTSIKHCYEIGLEGTPGVELRNFVPSSAAGIILAV